jgi:hypothetical protein
MKYTKTLVTLTLLTAIGATTAIAETTRIWWLQKDADTEFYKDSTTIPESSTTATFGPYTFTHIEIKPGADHPEAFLETRNNPGDENGSVMGINSNGGSIGDGGAKFDLGEEWTFAISTDFYLEGIRVDALTTAGEMSFLECSAWKGLEITPGDEKVLFDSEAGRFTFLSRWDEASGGTIGNGQYDAERLSGYAPLFVPAGTPITFGAPDDGVSSSDIGWFDFSDTAPEEPAPSYDGLAYIDSGWIYYIDNAAWAWVVGDPWMYNYTTGESKVASESGVDGYAHFSFPWLYSYTAATWLWIYGDMWIWDSGTGEYTVITPPGA